MLFLLALLVAVVTSAHVEAPNHVVAAVDPPPVGRVGGAFWADGALFLGHALPPNTGLYRRHGARGGFVAKVEMDANGLVTNKTDVISSVVAANNVTELDAPVMANGLANDEIVLCESGSAEGRVFGVDLASGVATQKTDFAPFQCVSAAARQNVFVFHDADGFVRVHVDGDAFVVQVRDDNFALVQVDAALNATEFFAAAQEEDATAFRGLGQGVFAGDGTYVFAETHGNRVLALSFTDVRNPAVGGIFRVISTDLHAPVALNFDREDRLLIGTASQSPTDACRIVEEDCYGCSTLFASCGRDSGQIFQTGVACKGLASFQDDAEVEPIVDLNVLGYGHRCVWEEEQAYALARGVCCRLGPVIVGPPPAAGVFRGVLRNNGEYERLASSVDEHALDVVFAAAVDPANLPAGRLLIVLRDDTRQISLESQGDTDLLMLVAESTNRPTAPVVIVATPLAAQPGETKGYSAVTSDANFREDEAASCTWVFDTRNEEATTCADCSCSDEKHTYGEAGQFTVRVTAKDESGLTSSPFEFEVTVEVAAPMRQTMVNRTEDGGAVLVVRGTDLPEEVTVKRGSMFCVANGDKDSVQYVHAEAFGLTPGTFLFPKGYKPNSRVEQTWLAEAGEALDGSTTVSKECVRVLRRAGTYPLQCVIHCNQFAEREVRIVVQD